jgi:DNA-binding winged helix-turn-helix (wHTH) protein
MRQPARHYYEFGPFRLETNERILLRAGQLVPLTPKAFETLLALVESGGRILDKEDLLRKIWPDTFVEEVSLAKNVSILRKILGEDFAHHYIETIPRRGYRFVAEVREIWEQSSEQTNGQNGVTGQNGTPRQKGQTGQPESELAVEIDEIREAEQSHPSTKSETTAPPPSPAANSAATARRLLAALWGWPIAFLAVGLLAYLIVAQFVFRPATKELKPLLNAVPLTSFRAASPRPPSRPTVIRSLSSGMVRRVTILISTSS